MSTTLLIYCRSGRPRDRWREFKSLPSRFTCLERIGENPLATAQRAAAKIEAQLVHLLIHYRGFHRHQITAGGAPHDRIAGCPHRMELIADAMRQADLE